MAAPVNHLEERLRDADDPFTEVMPAAITLAMMLRHRTMAAWLRTEFAGYGDGVQLPPYRLDIPGHIMAKSPQYGWIPAPVDETQQREFAQLDLNCGVKELEKICLSCKKGSGNQVAFSPEQLTLVQSQINLKAQLAITVSREHYCRLLRVIRSAIYLWTMDLIELDACGEHNSFSEAERAQAAHLDDPERFWRRAMDEEGTLPIPDVRAAGFFERVFGRAG